MKLAALRSTPLSAVLLTFLAPFAAAQGPHPEVPLFSLASGNQWTYMGEDTGGMVVFQGVRVAEYVAGESGRLSRIENYMFPVSDMDVLFYNDACAKTCEANPHFLAEQGRPNQAIPLRAPWYPCQFGCAMGSAIDVPRYEVDCVHGMRGHVTQIGKAVTVPAGTFPYSIIITYDEHPCCDDQIISETFVPGVGLVQRTVARLPGVQEWSLCFAIVNGKIIGSPEICSPVAPLPQAAAVETATWGTVKATFR